MNPDLKTFEVAVIGGGPIGIETAIELQRRGVSTTVIEAGPIGNTISWWAPQTRWFSSNDRIAIAGVPLHTVDQSKASREEYLNYLRTVVDQFRVQVQTYRRVVAIEPLQEASTSTELGSPLVDLAKDPEANGSFTRSTTTGRINESLRYMDGDARWRIGTVSVPTKGNSVNEPSVSWIEAKSVVLAVGGTDVPNRLNVPGESLPHVDGYLREVHRYHGRRVLIVGGRNSAVEAAIRLHRGGAKVTLCYHGETLPENGIKYWLRPEIEGLIRSGSVEARFCSRVVKITENSVTLQCNPNDSNEKSVEVEVDDVLTLIGYRQDQSLFERLGILSDDTSPKPMFDKATMQSPRDGIYVAGTAIGGTQSSKYQVFLENCHQHVCKIADHICGDRDRVDTNQCNPADVEPSYLDRRIELQPES